MADDKKNTGNQDRIRVNVEQDHEVRYWTKKWSVTEAELRVAVRDVLDEGHAPMVELVAKKLGK